MTNDSPAACGNSVIADTKGDVMWTTEELRIIFEAIEDKYGRGWAADKRIARLQAKLSIMLEAAQRREVASGD